MSDEESLGPLPQVDDNARLQALSVKALNAILKLRGDLLLRDERQCDFGVDASLEVLLSRRATNWRAQLQLKAVHDVVPNVDGSWSLAIEVYNVNYLLNGTTPLYLMYVESLDRFRMAWVVDERRRLDQDNPGWLKQKTVTIRFAEPFDDGAIEGIRKRIIDEERFRRETADALSRHALAESIRFSVDRSSLALCDSTTAYLRLKDGGITLVSNGKAKEALSLIDIVGESQKREPRIQLIAAYAYLSQGSFQKSFAFAGDAAVGRHRLSKHDQRVLSTIQDICEVHVGRISREEYVARQRKRSEVADADDELGTRFEYLRFKHLGEREEGPRQNALLELSKALNEIVQSGEYSNATKLQCRIHYAYAEGSDRSMCVIREIGLLRVRLGLKIAGSEPDPRQLFDAMGRLEQWDQGMARLIREADELGIPILLAEALRTRLVVLISSLSAQRFKSRFMKLGPGPSRAQIDEAKKMATAAITLFQEAEHREGELRARLEMAQILELADDDAAAREIAAEVLPIADALALRSAVSEAQSFLDGTTLLRHTEADMQQDARRDRDVALASMAVGDMHHYARMAAEAARLPADRYPVVYREVDAMRMIAIERLQFCRHIQQIQDLIHTFSPITAYLTDPIRFCQCLKHGYESLQGQQDARIVIDRFKSAYCDGCQDRAPKLTT